MKAIICILITTAASMAGQPILVKVTAQDLANLQKRDPMIRLEKPSADEAKVIRPVNQSIIKDSTILHDGQNWTLVPKGAVLHLPEAMKSRVNVRPVGTLLAWSDFLMKNRGWITTADVTFEQAAGTVALPEERAAHYRKLNRVVVAVHQTGPISVLVSKEAPTLTSR
jgi:hypothetical protein